MHDAQASQMKTYQTAIPKITIPASTFAMRRMEFLRRLGQGMAIFASAPLATRSNDTQYRYRQDSDFYYLTGFTEPHAVCLLLPQHPEHKFVLFVQPRDPERETWEGSRIGPEGAVKTFQADAAYNIEEIDKHLPQYLEKVDFIHYRFGQDSLFDTKVFNLLKHFRTIRQRTGTGPYGLLDPGEILHEMRLHKTAEEIKLLKNAANISVQAHVIAMQTVKPGMYEFELEALIEHQFRRAGATAPAYASIVGSGVNATILHYHENSRQLQSGDLVLVDAGAEYEYYCADITRTYPVNGRFTNPQRQIYEVVLEAQLAAINCVAPGVLFSKIHEQALNTLVDGLLRLKLLTGEKEKLIAEGNYRQFFMHKTSHWLGCDVHDVGKYHFNDQSRPLLPGMVLTIEPGIYIATIAGVAAEYHHIGVRIEDDILVTENGAEVLTINAPKEISELESIIGRGDLT